MARANFGKIGVILATAGSAVGLGNIWRFPYMTGENGGAAFILLYIACVFILGIPGMLCEFVVGRHGASNAVRAYQQFGHSPHWRIIGILGVITSMIILGFYAVVAGWCLQYLYATMTGSISGDKAYVEQYFADFSSDALIPILWAIAFIAITHYIIAKGVRGGIERASNVLMPMLFILLLIIAVASCSLPGASDGIRFLFMPDFSKLTSSVLIEALGQAFFSLSLGTACLCTYASYFSKQTNLVGSATQIACLDSLIAILAGLMIFPAAAAVGVSPDSGPSLIFITLPNVFSQAFVSMPAVGYIISILFYLLLSMAALTSTISMHEIGTAFFHEELQISRNNAAYIVTTICCIIAVFCSLSMGACPEMQIMGMPVLSFCDSLTADWLLPAGSLLTCILVGWFIPKHIVHDEFTNRGTVATRLYAIWLFLIRFVCPIAIIAIFIHQNMQ